MEVLPGPRRRRLTPKLQAVEPPHVAVPYNGDAPDFHTADTELEIREPVPELDQPGPLDHAEVKRAAADLHEEVDVLVEEAELDALIDEMIRAEEEGSTAEEDIALVEQNPDPIIVSDAERPRQQADPVVARKPVAL